MLIKELTGYYAYRLHGRRVFGCEGASVAPAGTVYICGQVELRDKENATQMIGDIPVALHLIIYRPGQQ